ncbi:F0F1 ATP synthase subunit delta [Pseudoxanthomonas sp. SGNA-20]|jgi:ATP synthase, F1 delta subunit|uniref:F0F1 ATP synthase subunit delta n=1 Tax=unclassified Pseudoxanthomonas TaxID=2645906 RepID=UPI000F62B1E9|nr:MULTISPECIES: F0F1 ATP synthase subunit delta [unclassified Pseudoxanthomonas]RRN59098.1 F0F1 ATP synthase subunit delta [Pseudoxanthomonas sp. SGNA-20]RRN81101.1 F0F1 ATP synthase subunit delta [Pseudoxanthomonas sp. SGD-10]
MSQALTLARPYARAAFGAARDQGRLDAWSQALAFSAQVAADPRVATLLLNPELGDEAAIALLAPQDADDSFRRFLAVLAEAGRLPLLAEIAGLFEQLRAEEQRVVRAKVTSATELSAEELEKIRAALRRRFGREVELQQAVDASLIGGAVIDTGDVVIDGSLKGKLARLQTALAG